MQRMEKRLEKRQEEEGEWSQNSSLRTTIGTPSEIGVDKKNALLSDEGPWTLHKKTREYLTAVFVSRVQI